MTFYNEGRLIRDVDGTVARESALRSAGTLLSRVRAPPSAPSPGGGPESLRSPRCGLVTYKTQPNSLSVQLMQARRIESSQRFYADST
ncbi:hypothetical protein PoB_004760700 [Plakobranchus ocellatus]|uniref:Uncharacterized protein n=1 Tax=Plakobranchus ocellatus TaxID=259542 RepID=A0AAV4BP25_9GAST|nr:hypothetical protein PoB_004760700 [Plakobranchus ocellatus]